MDTVLDIQTDKLAIPRRLTAVMKEIWALQPRFEQRSGRRPFGLLAHERFRAGFDFLVLRSGSGEAPRNSRNGGKSFSTQARPSARRCSWRRSRASAGGAAAAAAARARCRRPSRRRLEKAEVVGFRGKSDDTRRPAGYSFGGG